MKAAPDALRAYNAKRDFARTPEPRGQVHAAERARAFVIQKHAATALHYDLRLELDGVMLSWAVPKGPSLDPADKRLAMRTEDHPLSYNTFEGTIPEGHYGAGNVIVWDRGQWEPTGDAHAGMAAGKLEFRIHSVKLQGLWELVRTGRRDDERERWLLFKKRDEFARPNSAYDVTRAQPDSVVSGRALAPRGKAMPAASQPRPRAKSVKRAARTASAKPPTAKKADRARRQGSSNRSP
jgi:bifunctional non-homologous end joining protein LigD